jgi:hypothetical protein
VPRSNRRVTWLDEEQRATEEPGKSMTAEAEIKVAAARVSTSSESFSVDFAVQRTPRRQENANRFVIAMLVSRVSAAAESDESSTVTSCECISERKFEVFPTQIGVNPRRLASSDRVSSRELLVSARLR